MMREARQLRRVSVAVIWKAGWVIFLGALHFAVEVLRALAEKPPHAAGGYANLSTLASITGICYWLAIPWLAIVLVSWSVRRPRQEPIASSDRWLVALVIGTFLVASAALIVARSQQIAIFY